MYSRVQHTLSTYRRHLSVAAYVVLIVVVALVTYVIGSYFYGSQSALAPYGEYTFSLSSSTPTRLTISKLAIDAPFELIGKNNDGTIAIPKEYTTVGWYSLGPTPGEIGPSVVLGHVDSVDGAAVFYSLGKLDSGDRFTIEREDGSTAEFEVTSLARYKQSEFPTDLVYGPIDYAGIRLITCSGTYDKGTLRYSHNLVVYGRLVDPSAANVSASSTVEPF